MPNINTITAAARAVAPEINAAIAGERARISAILNSPEGLARPRAALHLALNADMPKQSVIELLAQMPSIAADNPYIRALENEAVNIGGPNVGTAAKPGSKEARLAEINGSMAHHNQTRYGIKAER